MHEFDQQDEQSAMTGDIRRLATELGRTPTITEFKRQRRTTAFSYDQILRAFGNWTNAVEAAGLAPNPIGEPPSNKLDRQALVDEFVRVANKLGRIPSHPLFSANSRMSRSPFQRALGSWREAVDAITQGAAGRFTFPIEKTARNSKEKPSVEPRRLGLSIPLLYVPRNETETLVLFALLAPRLGYEIQSAQIEFPDLTLRNGTEVIPTEVEFLSSTYLAHGHPIDASVLCVCWRKDMDVPGLRGILSLEAAVRSMPSNALQRTPASGRR
ncbi:MAG: hypothetical protein IT529_19375 [Burkholderiales bacterium]|nr:hypothetical protein [Burkholderiales bacterium]